MQASIALFRLISNHQSFFLKAPFVSIGMPCVYSEKESRLPVLICMLLLLICLIVSDRRIYKELCLIKMPF